MNVSRAIFIMGALGASVAMAACRRDAPDQARPSATVAPGPVSTTTITSAPTWTVAMPTRVEVPGDQVSLVAHGPPGERRAIVYLHGMCSSPEPDVADLADLSRAHGSIVALFADVPCGDGTNKWQTDETALQRRIDAALAAVKAARGGDLDEDRLTLVGESQGASRAESLVARYGERYPYVVLVGAPGRARPQSFARARAVAVVAGEREAQMEQLAGAKALDGDGIKSRFFEIPLAQHGELGPEGKRVMDEALTFLGR